MRIEVPRPDRGMKPQVGELMCFVRRTQVQLDLPRGDSRRLQGDKMVHAVTHARQYGVRCGTQ